MTLFFNILLFVIIGGTLASAGLTLATPQYWIIMLSCVGIQVVNGLAY